MKAFLKIPYEWVQKSGQGLTATEALVLADIQYWEKQSTLAERSERLGLSIEGLRKALSKLQEKGFEIPQSRKYISTKLKNEFQQSGNLNFNKVEKNTNKVENLKEKKENSPTPPIKNKKEIIKEYKEYSSPSASDGPKEKKEKPKVYSLQHRCKSYYEQEFKKFKGFDYYYEGADAGNLSQLLKKLKNAYEKIYGKQPTDDETETFFQSFINSLIIYKPDKFVDDKFTLRVINSQFNVVFPKLLKGEYGNERQQQQKSGPTDDFLRRVAAEVEANGGLAF